MSQTSSHQNQYTVGFLAGHPRGNGRHEPTKLMFIILQV
jgi:hypothetical protein